MNPYRFKDSLEPVSAELDSMVSRREKLLKESRDVISLSAKAIVGIHTGRLEEAEKLLVDVKRLLRDLRKVAGEDLSRYLTQPEAEYVEASVLRCIAARRPIPRHRALGVSSGAYILGLLDVIGELKRMVYDSIRRGETRDASNLFNIMEQLYIHLSPYAVYDHVVQGVKRKLDVSRMLIEDTRAAVTEDVRRTEFIKTVNTLLKRLQGKGK